MYSREIISNIQKWLNTRDVIILFGPRQVGKSTLLEILSSKYQDMLILNCENPIVSDILQSRDINRVLGLFGKSPIVALDEAQEVSDIGKILKLLYDDKRVTQKIIATGSSSFELANSTGEPLTGRNVKFKLYPLSLNEINSKKGMLHLIEKLNELLVFGSYPGIIDLPLQERKKKLVDMTGDYLFKDIFKFEQLRNPEILRKLLKALALQLGNLVSVNELAGLTGVSALTVERYLDLLEKSFVIFRLGPYSRNLRNELKKSMKYYFYDNGIRNAVINNFVNVSERTDVGAMWENFCVSEYLKMRENQGLLSNLWFWRTYDGAEIDLIEERDGKMYAYEFKWNPSRKAPIPISFRNSYNPAGFEVINRNRIDFFIGNWKY